MARKDESMRYRLWPVTPRLVAGLGAAGAVSAGFVAAFAYAGGFLSPGLLTAGRMIDTFQQVNGLHPGFRRNHSKGVCVTGHFEGNGNGARLSRAAVFEKGRVPVIGRFAVAIGVPYMPDSESEVRSMALSFRPAGAEEWRTGMNDIPVFPDRNAQGFHDRMIATAPDPATGRPDPEKVKAFFAAHPETVHAIDLIKARPFSTGFANASYNSLNAFMFVNAQGVSTPVRWAMVAVDPYVAEGASPAGTGVNYLFDDLVARLEKGPAQWKLVVTIGQPGDPSDDATLVWPADRESVEVGTLTLERAETEGPGNCRDINYDPLVLPDGIAPSGDPLLSARSAAYSTSFTRREGETKTPSQVQVRDSGKGS